MSLRILHVLDHSLPLHSGYSFRTLAILREQRALGWQTVHLTTPKQGVATVAAGRGRWLALPSHTESGRHRPARPDAIDRCSPGRGHPRTQPDLIHAHSPVLNALPSLWVGRRRRLPVVYEMRASWEDAAVDHGTTVEGSLRYRVSRALESLALRRRTR
jgi:glycogen(starch) synthase